MPASLKIKLDCEETTNGSTERTSESLGMRCRFSEQLIKSTCYWNLRKGTFCQSH